MLIGPAYAAVQTGALFRTTRHSRCCNVRHMRRATPLADITASQAHIATRRPHHTFRHIKRTSPHRAFAQTLGRSMSSTLTVSSRVTHMQRRQMILAWLLSCVRNTRRCVHPNNRCCDMMCIAKCDTWRLSFSHVLPRHPSSI